MKKFNNDLILENIPEYGLKIFQNKNYFKYGVDSIALAKFASSFKTNNVIVDMCSGSGIVGLVYLKLTENKLKENKNYKKIEELYFVDKQEYFTKLNNKNIEINNIANAKALNFDLKNNEINDFFAPESVDIILINPPYYIDTDTVKPDISSKEMSRCEDESFLEAFFILSKRILKSGGEIFMVNKPERLVDLFFLARKYKIEPKNMKNIISDPKKRNSLVLLRFVKNGKNFLKVEEPFIINEN